jgi:hypothetical protein
MDEEARTACINVCVRVRPRIELELEGRSMEEAKEVRAPSHAAPASSRTQCARGGCFVPVACRLWPWTMRRRPCR